MGVTSHVDTLSFQGTEMVEHGGEPASLHGEVVVIESKKPSLIHDPAIEQVNATAFRIVGKRDDSTIVPWGFWGAFLMAVVLGLVIVFRGASGLYSMWDAFWVAIALSTGAIMFKLGRRTSLNKELLCEVDMARQMMLWPSRDDDPNSTMLAVPFEELSEVVFGMTRYPVSARRADVMVHAFTLLVRDGQDRLVPIIEASPNKEEAHRIGLFLAENIGLPMTYVGIGIK
ncbi:MAG: hypothetical protein H0U74_02490 [Bradymonadaceae bacterium]|nr:hypothetical protein [Lujinxingiaceae bacterium]